MTADPNEVLTIEAVAAWLHCSPRTVQRKAAALGGFRFGRGFSFTRAGIDAYRERRRLASLQQAVASPVRSAPRGRIADLYPPGTINPLTGRPFGSRAS